MSLCPQEERKTLDRELARAKVTANRVAVVVANEWKDANDKVMPVKQWLEERRFLQVNVDYNSFSFSGRLALPNDPLGNYIMASLHLCNWLIAELCSCRGKCSNLETSLL